MIIRINKAQFEENIREWHDGVYVFELENCSSCDRLNTALRNVKSRRKIYVIDCSEDLNYYIEVFGMSIMPEVRLYISGYLKYRVQGVPKEKDMERFFHEELEDCNSQT